MLCSGIELLVLGNFLDNFLNNHIIINTNIAGVQFNVIITRYSRDFNGFLGRSLRIKLLSQQLL